MASQTVLRFDNAPSLVTPVPEALPKEQAMAFRRVAERRASKDGSNAATVGKGYALYNNPSTSSSGGSMDPLFHNWPNDLKLRADIPFTIGAKGGRFNRVHLQKKGGQFRDSFAYGSDGDADAAVKALLQQPQFHEAALRLHNNERPLIEPQILFANFFLPGEVQLTHTDVPEFRGVNRKTAPEWLMVAMHHSGLFARWYMPIATAVSWFSDHAGGEMAYYADPAKPGIAHPTPFNTALVLDTDSVYHGVDPTGGLQKTPPVIPSEAYLFHKGDGKWCVQDGSGKTVAGYEDLSWGDIRMSVQWKAYCFKDEAERQAWLQHTDDLSPSKAFEMLVEEVVRRGKASGKEDVRELAGKICQEFIRIPDELKEVHGTGTVSKL